MIFMTSRDVNWRELGENSPIDISLLCQMGKDMVFEIEGIQIELNEDDNFMDSNVKDRIMFLNPKVHRMLDMFLSSAKQIISDNFSAKDNEQRRKLAFLEKKIEITSNGLRRQMDEYEKEDISKAKVGRGQMIHQINMIERIVFSYIYDSLREAIESYKKDDNKSMPEFYMSLFHAASKRYSSFMLKEADGDKYKEDDISMKDLTDMLNKPEPSNLDTSKEREGMSRARSLMGEEGSDVEPDEMVPEEAEGEDAK